MCMPRVALVYSGEACPPVLLAVLMLDTVKFNTTHIEERKPTNLDFSRQALLPPLPVCNPQAQHSPETLRA